MRDGAGVARGRAGPAADGAGAADQSQRGAGARRARAASSPPTGGDRGACLDDLPEVRAALAGHYAAVARGALHDEPSPPLDSPSRRGSVRVFTVTPVRSDGRVIGAVYMSRTSSSPLEAVWDLRYTVLLARGVVPVAALAGEHASSRAIISRPVQAITAAVEAVARGEPPQPFAPGGLVPAEVATLSAALDRMTAQLTDRATLHRATSRPRRATS